MKNTLKNGLEVDEAGNKWWYKDGKFHREDGPAVEFPSMGVISWYQYGKLHRLGGPAIECDNGHKKWYQNDKLHRLDGPAIELSNNHKLWYYEGKYIDCKSQEEFERIIKLKLFW